MDTSFSRFLCVAAWIPGPDSIRDPAIPDKYLTHVKAGFESLAPILFVGLDVPARFPDRLEFIIVYPTTLEETHTDCNCSRVLGAGCVLAEMFASSTNMRSTSSSSLRYDNVGAYTIQWKSEYNLFSKARCHHRIPVHENTDHASKYCTAVSEFH